MKEISIQKNVCMNDGLTGIFCRNRFDVFHGDSEILVIYKIVNRACNNTDQDCSAEVLE